MHEAHPSSPVSPLYSLDEYLEWSSQFAPFDAACRDVGPCRAIYLYRCSKAPSKHEYLIFGFGKDEPENWYRVDRLASITDRPGPLSGSSSRELVCFASSREDLLTIDSRDSKGGAETSREIASIIMDLPITTAGLLCMGEVGKYMRQSVLDFPETTLFSSNTQFFARCTFNSMIVIMCKTTTDTENVDDPTTKLNWGKVKDTDIGHALTGCRELPHHVAMLDSPNSMLARCEGILHASYMRSYVEDAERKVLKALSEVLRDLQKVGFDGPVHLRRPARALAARTIATMGYRWYLLGSWHNAKRAWKDCCNAAPWASKLGTTSILSPLSRHATLS